MRGFTHPHTQILLPLARRARSSRPAAETLSGSTGQRIRPCSCRSQDRTAEMRHALACVLVATASAARLRGAANDNRERRRLNARTRAAHHLAAMATHDDEAWCRSNKHAHHVKPGTSFGTLQTAAHESNFAVPPAHPTHWLICAQANGRPEGVGRPQVRPVLLQAPPSHGQGQIQVRTLGDSRRAPARAG